MTTRSTKTRVLVLGAILMAVAAFAMADGHHGKCQRAVFSEVSRGAVMEPPHGGMPPKPPFLHGIDLSDAQEEAVFKLMYQQEPTLFEKSRVVAKAGESLHRMAESGRLEQDKARALANEIALATTEIILLHAETESRVVALLTPEQRKQLAANKSKQPSKVF